MTIHPIQKASNRTANTASCLNKALAETKLETAKAQTFHWNVKGMAFGPLHALFQTIYEDHFEAEDTLAERMRALGQTADGRLSEVLATSDLSESAPEMKAQEMISALADDQWHLSETLYALAKAAEADGDQVTADMATERSSVHDKFAWMLRAHLAE